LLSINELQEKITKRKKSQWGFEKLLVHPDNEKKIKPLEKILAPKGFYPNHKNGNLTADINQAIAKFQAGESQIKTDKSGNINMVIGKTDFTLEQLETNYKSAYDKIISLRPANWKGKFLNKITLSTTMGPGLRVLF
jgi:large subunit ribosomal protein L1